MKHLWDHHSFLCTQSEELPLVFYANFNIRSLINFCPWEKIIEKYCVVAFVNFANFMTNYAARSNINRLLKYPFSYIFAILKLKFPVKIILDVNCLVKLQFILKYLKQIVNYAIILKNIWNCCDQLILWVLLYILCISISYIPKLTEMLTQFHTNTVDQLFNENFGICFSTRWISLGNQFT